MPEPETLIALFRNRLRAEEAAAALRRAGFAGAELKIVEDGDLADAAPGRSLFGAFSDFFAPEPGAPEDALPASLTVSGLAPAAQSDAATLISDAGGRVVQSGDGPGEAADDGAERVPPGPAAAGPRRVQPGFADVEPGYTPEPAAFPDPREDLGQTQGRFAEQLDDAPQRPERPKAG